jgi:hypothetical protein
MCSTTPARIGERNLEIVCNEWGNESLSMQEVPVSLKAYEKKGNCPGTENDW